MPSKDRDVEVEVDDRPRDKARRSKSERKPDYERDRDREHRRHKSTRSSKSKLSGEGSDTHSHASRRHKNRDRPASISDVGVDFMKDLAKSSLAGERVSMPYPSFSKAHSKEAVQSRDSLPAARRGDPLTPEPTDVGGDDEKRRRKSDDIPRRSPTVSKKSSRPPSPPETDLSAEKKRMEDAIRDGDLDRPKSRASALSRSASRNEDRTKLGVKSAVSSQATYIKRSVSRASEKIRSESRASSSSRHSSHQSAKRTSSTRSVKRPEPVDVESSPSSAQDSSPKTPTPTVQFPQNYYAESKPETPAFDIEDVDSNLHSKTATPASGMAPPPPPPPPPPALNIPEAPRVDYLLQNGGLPYPVPKTFLSVLPRQNGTRPSNPPLAGAETLFAPFFNLLDQYSTVLNKHGSVAVATGHRSVARRLLDRLENVFSRDLPEHGCSCVMCDRSHEIHRGLTWGDVLEWASGRIELPKWPPFDLAELGAKAAELSADVPPRPASPVNMDPDISEEFREHYLRQSKKVRSAVDKWLSSTAETPVPPSQDVDDETLTFAILTSLDAEDRPYFNALLSGSRELRPATRAPTPVQRQRNDLLVKTGLSLQRLYRLQQVPRDAEAATYLIKNPHTHDLLVTLSDINNSEWEILISGRFDGFLWSGADPDDATPNAESRGPTPMSYFHTRSPMSPGLRVSSAMSSRNATPFSMYSRGTTPASFVSLASSGMPAGRLPVSNDEEMEMASIAEIEREIYKGMETLEDAFEKLHHQAEIVRTSLRQRGAALMQNLQSRRRIDVLSNPGSGNSQSSGYERPSWATEGEGEGGSEDDWMIDDMTEIMPDDSASNISSSRHRRPKRRTERRTPAPIEEEEDEEEQ